MECGVNCTVVVLFYKSMAHWNWAGKAIGERVGKKEKDDRNKESTNNIPMVEELGTLQ